MNGRRQERERERKEEKKKIMLLYLISTIKDLMFLG
jgi:hypothetical protein